MKILLINSDLAKNRGDRAITEGIIQLALERFPSAQITGISEEATRDTNWFGINFLRMDAQSLNPAKLLQLIVEARRSDIIFWGGGELLKDYTNKTALFYWVGKMWLISLANKNLYGAYQGIGPTKSSISKSLIRFIVGRCKLFTVRDEESNSKLIEWGCSPNTVLTASDPAILPLPSKLTDETKMQLSDVYGIEQDFLDNFVSVGPRDWFHYKPGGIIPYKYKKKIKLFSHPDEKVTKKHNTYLESLIVISETILQKGYYLLFVPMHMDEEDIKLCEYLRSNVSLPERIRILDSDTLSPTHLRSVLACSRLMVGFRLHSTIIATSGSVPCINYYYVDKGRAYFNQIEQNNNAFPIEDLLARDFEQRFNEVFSKLEQERHDISNKVAAKLKVLRKSIRATYAEMVDSYD